VPQFFLFFSSQSLTAVVKVWSSSSMRRTRPKEPSRPFQPVSLQSFLPQPSSPARVPGRKKKRRVQQAAKRQPKTTCKSRFRFLFVPILRPFYVPRATYTMARFQTICDPHGRCDDCEWSARSILLSGVDDDGDPARSVFTSLSHRFTRAFQSSPESDSIE